jgi:hypothetical protein
MQEYRCTVLGVSVEMIGIILHLNKALNDKQCYRDMKYPLIYQR